MTGKCAKVVPKSDTFKNGNPEALHRFVEFFRHNSDSLPPLHTEALCQDNVTETKTRKGIIVAIHAEIPTQLDPWEVASD